MALIRAATLAKTLYIDLSVLNYWDTTGFLQPITSIHGERHYNTDDVDKILQRNAYGFVMPPTIKWLSAERIVLLSPGETARLLNRSLLTCSEYARKGRLQTIQLKGEFRYIEASVKRYLALRAEVISRTVLRHVCNISSPTLTELERGSPLQRTQKEPQVEYTLASVLAFIRNFQSHKADEPSQWLSDHYPPASRPLKPSDAARFVGGFETLMTLLRTGQLRYLQFPSGSIQVSAKSILAYTLRQPPLNPLTIGMNFGVSQVKAAEWMKAELINCPLHTGRHELRQPCLLALLSQCIFGRITPARWYARAKSKRLELITVDEAALILKVTPDAVVEMAQAGNLVSLRRPDGIWMIPHTSARNKCKDMKRPNSQHGRQ